MTDINHDTHLTLAQLQALGAQIQIPLGQLSPLIGAEKVAPGRITNPDLVDERGDLKVELTPAFSVLADPWAVTALTCINPATTMDVAFYFPGDPAAAPSVALANDQGDLRLQVPAPQVEYLMMLSAYLGECEKQPLNIRLDLSLMEAWVWWAMVDHLKPSPDDNTVVSFDQICATLAEPMQSLLWFAAYFREALNLAIPAQAEVRKACENMAAAGFIEKVDSGYTAGKDLLGMAGILGQLKAHLYLKSSILMGDEIGTGKMWYLQGRSGLGLFWYDDGGKVQLKSVSPGEILAVAEQVLFDPVHMFGVPEDLQDNPLPTFIPRE